MGRLATLLAVVLSLAAAACSDERSTSPVSPSSPVTTATSPASGNALAGTWVGSAVDTAASAGATVLGISMGPGMMGRGGWGTGWAGDMTWIITQTGDSFTGNVAFGGFQCAQRMTMSGTFSGNGGTFTISMPANSMPVAACSGTAHGTFSIDPVTGQMRGTYSGTNTCMGAFSGQLTLVRK